MARNLRTRVQPVEAYFLRRSFRPGNYRFRVKWAAATRKTTALERRRRVNPLGFAKAWPPAGTRPGCSVELAGRVFFCWPWLLLAFLSYNKKFKKKIDGLHSSTSSAGKDADVIDHNSSAGGSWAFYPVRPDGKNYGVNIDVGGQYRTFLFTEISSSEHVVYPLFHSRRSDGTT